jgi:NDP-sugar pyrophosphorylase family protein
VINILIPMSGKNWFKNSEFQYPKPLIEIKGKPMIEHVVNSLSSDIKDKRFIFVVNSIDCQKFHLDMVLRLITNEKTLVVKLDKPAKGAACSALMAIEAIENDTPLIISNSDHIIDYDLGSVINHFQERNVDAGTVCFEAIHPKWSFVRIDENQKIIETAEKRPLSRNAIAGFYYFRKGSFFVDAAMRMIEKDSNIDDAYYIAPTLNELVLKNMNLEIFIIPSSQYHNFYSPHKISEFIKTN